MSRIDHESLDRALGLLGDLMRVRHHPPIHLVVCGGSALIALRLVTRTTQDVDVLATLENGQLHCARPLPEWLLTAAEAVRSELSLPTRWLNDGPADENLFRLGLPVGMAERLVARDFGAALQVSFISRHDQIHFKLYAAADQGGRHFTDLRKLNPTPEQLLAAARWTLTQDASATFRQAVVESLHALGHGDLHERL